jgi:hypothetical protein
LGIVNSACISFMARDGEHFFMCFLTICTSSFEKALFSSFAHFYIGSLILGGVWFFGLPVCSGYSPLSGPCAPPIVSGEKLSDLPHLHSVRLAPCTAPTLRGWFHIPPHPHQAEVSYVLHL